MIIKPQINAARKMRSRKDGFMKKVLGILLAISMVVSCLSIASEEEAYLEFTMNAKDGKVSGKFGAGDREIALPKFFVRFDILKEANLVIVPQK